MGVNKVIYGNTTVMDISDSTVTPETLLSGVTAYNAAGVKIVGTLDTDPFFNVTGDLSLATMQITNLSESFADAISAISAGKTVKLSLNYINPFGVNETSIAINALARSDLIRFYPLMVADFGAGNSPYVFDAQWRSSGMTLAIYPLAVQS